MAQSSSGSERADNIDLFHFPGFIVNNKNNVEDYTPIAKIPCGSVLNHADSAKYTEESSSSATTKTPPVEPSVSPEIQSGMRRSVLASGATPATCYGAGHVISGVTDRRKCKAKGILSVGRTITNPFEHDILKEDIYKKSRPSMIPFPAEASISWHLSPSHEDDNVGKDDYSNGLYQPSPSNPDFEGLLEPSLDKMVTKTSFDFKECSPFSPASLSSGNIMQTPNSDSSLERHGSLSCLKEENSDSHKSWISNSTLENVSVSEMRISWRDGLENDTFDKDDLDCCRLLSDEERDTDGLLKSPKFVENEARIDGDGKEIPSPSRLNPCAESTYTDDGGLIASGDSDWTLYYKNRSFVL